MDSKKIRHQQLKKIRKEKRMEDKAVKLRGYRQGSQISASEYERMREYPMGELTDLNG
jgi:hypothetical protein